MGLGSSSVARSASGGCPAGPALGRQGTDLIVRVTEQEGKERVDVRPLRAGEEPECRANHGGVRVVEDERRDQTHAARAGEDVEGGENLANARGAQPRDEHLGRGEIEAADAGSRDPTLAQLPLEALEVAPAEDHGRLDPRHADDGEAHRRRAELVSLGEKREGQEEERGQGLAAALAEGIDGGLHHAPLGRADGEEEQLGPHAVQRGAKAAVEGLQDDHRHEPGAHGVAGGPSEHDQGKEGDAPGDPAGAEQQAHQHQLHHEGEGALSQIDVGDEPGNPLGRDAAGDRCLEEVVDQRGARGGEERQHREESQVRVVLHVPRHRPGGGHLRLDLWPLTASLRADQGQTCGGDGGSGGDEEQSPRVGEVEGDPRRAGAGDGAQEATGGDEAEGALGLVDVECFVGGEPELNEDQRGEQRGPDVEAEDGRPRRGEGPEPEGHGGGGGQGQRQGDVEASAPEAPLERGEHQHAGSDGEVEPGEPGDGLLDEEQAVPGGLEEPVGADQKEQEGGVRKSAAGEAHRSVGCGGGAHDVAGEGAPSGLDWMAPLRARWRARTRQATNSQVAVSTTFIAAKP